MLLFPYLLITQLNCKLLVSSFTANQANDNYWAVVDSAPLVTTCNGEQIFGGYQKFYMSSEVMRYFVLPPHFKLYIELIFYRIDQWDGDYFNIWADGLLVYSKQFFVANGSPKCGITAQNDEIISISIATFHTSNYVAINMRGVEINAANNENWGFSYFSVSIEPCPAGCDYCTLNSHLQCKQWNQIYKDNYQNYLFFDYSLYQFTTTQYLLNLPKHSKIMIKFRLLIQATINVKVILDNTINYVESYSLQSQFAILSEFSIPPLHHYKDQIVIYIQRNEAGQINMKNFEVFIFKDEYTKLPVIQGCQNLIDGNCWQCKNGWNFDNEYSNCLPICGDSLIVGDEQCDDGNTIPNDGCNQCRFQCISNCSSCKFGICSACQKGYFFDYQKKCSPYCGESYRIPYLKECDNEIKSKNYVCEIGWIFDKKVSSCSSICGDQLIVGNEECDDGNNIPNDGCYQCRFSCALHCKICKYGKCQQCEENYYLNNYQKCKSTCKQKELLEECNYNRDAIIKEIYQCESGWQFNCQSQSCQPICGDKLVVGGEFCDDGNDTPSDGCYLCQFDQNPHCSTNRFGICQQCEEDYFLDSNHRCVLKSDYMVLVPYLEKMMKQNSCEDGWVLISQLEICKPVCGDNKIVGNELCDDGNEIPSDGCYLCEFNCSLHCVICNFGFCEQCEPNYFLDKDHKCHSNSEENSSLQPYDQSCRYPIFDQQDNGWIQNYIFENYLPSCGDALIVGNEQCDDGNDIPNDGCYQCNFDCVFYCINCKFGICYQCEQGFILNYNSICNRINPQDQINSQLQRQDAHIQEQYQCGLGLVFDQIIQSCLPICGDNFITESESCDDGNDIPTDGCYKCQFNCDQECRLCNLGRCLSCQQGYYVNEKNTCSPICGDGMVIPYLEECDENTIYQDQCLSCIIECPNSCSHCQYGICIKCELGFYLIEEQCLSLCGDLIIASDEDCDDGNDKNFDGCYQCKFSCYENCQQCSQGICLDQCSYGQLMMNQKCESICGNKIVTEFEECDDGNAYKYDGCFQCLFSCPLSCSLCEAGQCLQCSDEFHLSNNKCLSDNGDFSYQQECEDGNTIANDGCYNYQIESNWVCNSAIPNECSFISNPIMVVKYLNQTFSNQYVQITFSEEIILSSIQLVSQAMILRIQNTSEKNYNITIYPIKEATKDLSLAEYIIQVNIFQSVSIKPILSINLNSDLINQYEVPILNTQQELALELPKILNPIQRQYAEYLKNFNTNIIIGLGSFSLIALLLGETLIFQEILDILQYYSFLKFMNVDFPENLYIFFQALDLVSISPLLQFLPLDIYINKLSFKQETKLTNGKFSFYQQDTDLITNLLCQILQFLGLILIVLLLKIFQHFLFRNLLISKYFYCMSQVASKTFYGIVFRANQLLCNRLRNTLQLSQFVTFDQLRRLLLVNGWDLLFKTFLYTTTINIKNVRDYIQASLSIIIGILYTYIIFDSITKKVIFSKKRKVEHDQIQQQMITLGRQMVFLIILVFVQNNQAIQTILISMTSLFYFIIIKNKIHLENNNFIQKLVEGTVILFTASSVIYFEDFQQVVGEETKIFIGFLQIALLCLALVVEVIKFVMLNFKSMFQYFRKIIKESQNKNNKQGAPVTLFY